MIEREYVNNQVTKDFNFLFNLNRGYYDSYKDKELEKPDHPTLICLSPDEEEVKKYLGDLAAYKIIEERYLEEYHKIQKFKEQLLTEFKYNIIHYVFKQETINIYSGIIEVIYDFSYKKKNQFGSKQVYEYFNELCELFILLKFII